MNIDEVVTAAGLKWQDIQLRDDEFDYYQPDGRMLSREQVKVLVKYLLRRQDDYTKDEGRSK